MSALQVIYVVQCYATLCHNVMSQPSHCILSNEACDQTNDNGWSVSLDYKMW